MKNFFLSVLYLALALPLLPLEALFAVALMLHRAGEAWFRTARELREAPPSGGVYGTMARRLRERARSGSPAPHEKTIATYGEKNG